MTEKGKKGRLLVLLNLLKQKTDEDHPMRIPEITEELKKSGYKVSRRSLFYDFDLLREQNYNIELSRDPLKRGYYYERQENEFETSDVKLLVDAMLAAKFVSSKQRKAIIKKLCALTLDSKQELLKRDVYIADRDNAGTDLLSFVDLLHTAIYQKTVVEFVYNDWNARGQLVPRHEGALYRVSPYRLVWNNGYYYLVGFRNEKKKVEHFRVDKMTQVQLTDSSWVFVPQDKEVDLSTFSRQTFSMFGGPATRVSFVCRKDLVGQMIDRFGTIGASRTIDDNWIGFYTVVQLSPTFYAWVLGFNGGLKIKGPVEAVTGIQELCKKYLEEGETHV